MRLRGVAALGGRVAPAVSRHPGAWDWVRQLAPRAACDVLIERRIYPFEEFDQLVGPNDMFRPGLKAYEHIDGLYATRRPTVLLPRSGWAVTTPLTLEERGVIDFSAYRNRRPGMRRYMAGRAVNVGRMRHLESALSFQTIGADVYVNYFHMLNDLIGGRLRLADEHGVPTDTPVVISQALADFPPFQEIRLLPTVAERQWIVQGPAEMINCRRLFVGQTGALSRASIAYTRSILAVPDSDLEARDRIFVARGGSRQLTNQDEIEAVCRDYGFRPVDPAKMTLAEQMSVFSRAAYVIGTHGAGLANIIFRKNAPLRLLEVFPGPAGAYQCSHYFYICHWNGFGYRSLFGESREECPWPEPFSLDRRVFANALEAMVG